MTTRFPPPARFGLKRMPWLTATVLAITTATALAQLAMPELLPDLERTPAALHGQWWRIVTALFVQDGGLLGAVSNLVFLAVVGTIAEQLLPAPRWLAHYFGVGLLTELVGYAWQPIGGGNSIAICGLAGALAVACWRHDGHLPAHARLRPHRVEAGLGRRHRVRVLHRCRPADPARLPSPIRRRGRRLRSHPQRVARLPQQVASPRDRPRPSVNEAWWALPRSESDTRARAARRTLRARRGRGDRKITPGPDGSGPPRPPRPVPYDVPNEPR